MKESYNLRGRTIDCMSAKQEKSMHKNSPLLATSLQILLVGLMLAIVFAQSNPLYHAPNRDGGLFMYMGEELLKGKVLYVDMWDNKGPLIFYLNALGLFLGHGHRWGVWGLEFIFVFIAAFLGFSMMKRIWGLAPAIFGTAIWLAGLNNIMRGGNFTEDYSLLFNFLALYLFGLELQKGSLWFRQFLIGVMLGFNFLLRANNIGVELSIGLVIVTSALLEKEYSQSLKKIAWMVAGVLFVIVLTAFYFYSLGTLKEMVTAGYIYNLYYSGETGIKSSLPASLGRGLGLLGSQTSMPALLGFFVLFEKLLLAIRTGQRRERDLYMVFLVGWPLEMVLSSLSGRDYPHYYICWLPYVAFLSGLSMNYIVSHEVNEKLQKYIISLPIIISLLAISNLSVMDQYKTTLNRILFQRSEGIEYVDPVAKYIRDHTHPSDTVLVWGFQPYINLMARRSSSTGILSYPVLVKSPFSDKLNEQYYRDLVENRPVLIVDMVNLNNDTIPHIDPDLRAMQEQRLKRFRPPSNLDDVFEYIFSNYHLETRFGNVMVYRLNDAVP